MVCDKCGSRMANVGREIQPGNPAIWMDGYVCPTPGCPGHATFDHQGNTVRWPALTLMGAGVHLYIRGAMKFRDSQAKR